MVTFQEDIGCLGRILCAYTVFYSLERSSLCGVNSLFILMGSALVCEKLRSVNIPIKKTLQQQAQESHAVSPAIVYIVALNSLLTLPANLGAEKRLRGWIPWVSLLGFNLIIFMCEKASRSMQGT